MAVIFSGRKETTQEDWINDSFLTAPNKTSEEILNNNPNIESQINKTTEPVKKISKPRKKKAVNPVQAVVESSPEEPIELYCSKDECGPKGPKGNDDSEFVTGLDVKDSEEAKDENYIELEFVHIKPEAPNPFVSVGSPETLFNDDSGSHGMGAIFDEEDPERDDEESEED